MALWLLAQNPNIADGLGISIRSKGPEGAAANYLITPRIMQLFSGQGSDTTVVHELLHHAERMMPENVQAGIEAEWMKQIVAVLNYAIKTKNLALTDHVRQALAAADGDPVSYQKVTTAINRGELSYDFYQYVNPSEFWAVNASEIIKARAGDWVSQATQWIREFVSRMAEVFGLPNNFAIIRGVEAVLNAEGQLIDAEMLINRGAPTEVDSLFSIADASAFVSDLVHTDNELNWVKNKFGTPQNIALTSPAFKPVFDEGQAFLTDISRFANMAGDAALSILPRIDRLRDVLPGMLGGVKLAKKEDLSAAMGASMAGTLFGGGSPLKGRVWTDTELRAGGTARTSLLTPFFQSFTPLNDAQIALYRQARASIDISLDNFGKGVFHRLVRGVGITFDRDMALDDIAQVIRNAIQDDITDQQAVITLASTLVSAKTLSDAQNRITELEKLIQSVTDIENKITDLKTHGYVPAMRFGKYAVYLTETNPATNKVKQVYFGLYESQTSANLAAMRLRKEYPNADPPIRGLLTTKQHEMFQGLSVDVIENFAEYMTDENGVPISKDPLIQGFLRAAVAQRSALKHQIHRKGVAGYSEDIARVLSTFTLSMARNASSNFHFAELDASTNKVPAGDLKDYAIDFVKYLKDPVEEAQAIRAFLFIEYLGGSIINGLINMTQAPLVGLPYLRQFTSSADAAIKITAAATGSVSKLAGAVKVAYERAKIEGVVAPQEIHQLRAESSGTPVGTSIALRKFAAAWGVIYSVTEQFNRTTMFVAAYNIAVEKAMANPYAFAKQAVDQTQFIYNKGNRPVTSRGAIGSVARTFTQFGVSYLELAKRLYNARGTAGSMPFALLVLMLLFAAGAEGLPFVEDVEDILDTIGQWMGFATNTKKSLHRFVRDTVGDTAGQIILKGVSGIPGMPVDLSLRFSMANMIPGTALFKPSEANKAKALIEIVGPAGQFLPVEGTMMGNALNRLSKNDFFGATVALAPKAVQNVEKGRQMLERGYYPDAKGRRGVDTTPSEAILKMVGAQPASVARQAVITQDILSSQAIQRREENEIVEQWAVGIAEKNPKEIASARAKMIAWNAANPEYRVVITSNQLRDRIKQLKLPQDVRLIKSAPKEMRREAAEELRR